MPRKAVPTNLKVLKGTDQPCRINKHEPKPETNNIQMPSGLSEEAQKHWDIVVQQLLDAGVMTNLDAQALGMYCEVYSRWAFANQQIQTYGPVIRTPTGFPTQSPFMQIANKAFDQMKGILTEFGMTPASRTRVSMSEEGKNEADPWNKFG